MKFEQSDYNKIWSATEGREIMSAILRNPDLLRANFTFWKQKFKVDPEMTPSNAKGVAAFVSEMREIDTGELMELRAPLSDTIPADKKGVEAYSGTIPDFSAKGYVETAAERMYREELFDQYADVANIVKFATNELQRMLNSVNQTISYQAAQLLSTGKIIYDKGQGSHIPVLKAKIPAQNFLKAGKKVWTDTKNCRILDQMRDIENRAKDIIGVEDIAMQWEVTRQQFLENFLPNAQVLEWARYTNIINNTPLPESAVLTPEMAKTAIAKFEGLSPIVIVEEKQVDATAGIVHGWKDGIAVLRPAGYAGYVRRAPILDVKAFSKYGNSINSYNFTPAADGLGQFMNSVVVNGNFKEWHTDLFIKAVPTLDEFLYHFIVDTTQADV